MNRRNIATIPCVLNIVYFCRAQDGCDFTSFLTVFQSYQDDGQMRMKVTLVCIKCFIGCQITVLPFKGPLSVTCMLVLFSREHSKKPGTLNPQSGEQKLQQTTF